MVLRRQEKMLAAIPCLLALHGACRQESMQVHDTRPRCVECLGAANALHQALLETTSRRGLSVSYKGALSRRRARGRQPVNRPLEWAITTSAEYDMQPVPAIATVLFTVRMRPANGEPGTLRFRYLNRDYSVELDLTGTSVSSLNEPMRE